MATPFPPPSEPEEHAALHPHAEMREAPAKPSADGHRLRRTPLVAAAIVLIAAGALLIWTVRGSVAGVDTNAIGVIGIALGVIGLIAPLVATRRSRRRDRSAGR